MLDTLISLWFSVSSVVFYFYHRVDFRGFAFMSVVAGKFNQNADKLQQFDHFYKKHYKSQ